MIPKISDLPQLDPIYAQYLNALKVSAFKGDVESAHASLINFVLACVLLFYLMASMSFYIQKLSKRSLLSVLMWNIVMYFVNCGSIS